MKKIRLIPDDLGFLLSKQKYLPGQSISIQSSVENGSKLYEKLYSLAKNTAVKVVPSKDELER